MQKKIDHLIPAMIKISTILEHESINQAAAHLNVSQPSLSKALRSVELALGLPLVQRTARGVAPTEAGAVLIKAVRSARTSIGAALADIESLTAKRTHEVRLASTPLAAALMLPRAVALSQQRRPAIKIRAVETHRSTSMLQLQRGELDIVLCPAEDGPGDPRLIRENLFEDDLAPWVRATSPIGDDASVKVADLARHDWILPQRESSLFHLIERAMNKVGLVIKGQIFESSSVPICKSLLLSADRIVVWDRGHLKSEIKAGLVRPITTPLVFGRNVHCIYTRAEAERSRSVETVLSILREVGRDIAISRTIGEP